MTSWRMERLVAETIERSIRQVPAVVDIDTLLVAGRCAGEADPEASAA